MTRVRPVGNAFWKGKARAEPLIGWQPRLGGSLALPCASGVESFYFLPTPLYARGMPHHRPLKIGVFPGQFDPITNGHIDVIRRGVVLFDELIVGVGINPEKRELFPLDERVKMVKALLKDQPAVRVERYEGLTVDFVKQSKATAILRGIRDVSDLRYEFQLALANRAVGGVETVFVMTGDQYALTSSSLIRQVVALGGDVRQLRGLLPELVIERLRERQRKLGPQPMNPDAPAY